MSSSSSPTGNVDEPDELGVSFTALVVTFNEDSRLQACLESLAFADQLIVVDLGSEDHSVEIARECGAEVVHHERLPVVEQVRARVIDRATHDWVLFLDPDEVFHPALAERAAALIQRTDDVGRIFLPWKFYFRGRPLQGTRWGGRDDKGCLIHKDRCRLKEDVHRGMEVKERYRTVRIPWDDPTQHIRHYWIDSFSQLIEKHRRYIRQEGKSRFNDGQRFSWPRWALETLLEFGRCFIYEEGWRDGTIGLFLSLFSAWYESKSLLALRDYQHNVASSRNDTSR